MAEGKSRRLLRAVHQFHGGSAIGDGITNGMLFTQRLLRELGFYSEIFAINPAAELRHVIRPYSEHPGHLAGNDEILLVHFSMGHEDHSWIDTVACDKILVWHNITPERFLHHESLRRAAALGRNQIAVWGQKIQAGIRPSPFIGAISDSNFNQRELLDAGFDDQLLQMATLPLLVDLDLHRKMAGAPKAHSLSDPFSLPVRLLFVGRLVANKCQHELISILAQLRARMRRRVHLTLVGDGDEGYIASLKALAEREHVADALHITGKISNQELGEYYRNADLFVCLSEHEGFCMPLIEAAIHRIPILAYAAGGAVSETLGEGALILTQKSQPEIIAAIILLLEEPALRRSVVDGQTANLARFEPEALKRALGNYIEKLGFRMPTFSSRPVKSIIRQADYRIEGPLTSSYSLALVNRELGLALAQAGKHVELRSMEGQIGQFLPDEEFLGKNESVAKLMAQSPHSMIEAQPADVCLRDMFPPRTDDIRAANIKGLSCYAWEETGVPSAYVEAMNRSLDIVTVISNHVGKILKDNGVYVPISVVGSGADHLQRSTRVSSRQWFDGAYGKKAKGFRFLHISSGFPRKGVDLLFKAWSRLSQQQDWNASLVIKTFKNPHNNIVQMIEDLQQENSTLAPIVLIEDELQDTELLGLYDACDAVVAPSRAEGYGLPLAEAMLAGKPVITTAWGGQLDFCSAETAWLVDWRFSEAKTHLSIPASVWAEPILDDLIQQMNVVRNSSAEQLEPRIKAAQNLLLKQYTWQQVAQRVDDAITKLKTSSPAKDLALPKIALVSSWGSQCGIATYAEAQVSAIPNSQLYIFANEDAQPLKSDGPRVYRTWRTGLQDDLSRLGEALLKCDPDVVVFQFNFGFFQIDALGKLINKLRDAGKAVHIVLHSTADVCKPDLRITLRDAAPALARATRLIVHGVTDLNRLKSFGLHSNTVLIPHGVPFLPNKNGTESKADSPARRTRDFVGLKRRPLIATFGFLLPGKGIIELIQAQRLLVDRARRAKVKKPHLLLVNALYPSKISEEEYEACISCIQDLKLTRNVTIVTEFLPELEALTLLQMSDLIVYGYQSSQESASGAVRLGLASGAPVAVTPLPIFEDVRDVTHQLPGVTPDKMAEGVENILRASGLWRGLQWSSPKANSTIKDMAEKQSAWVDACAWPNVARRFWGLLRATASE